MIILFAVLAIFETKPATNGAMYTNAKHAMALGISVLSQLMIVYATLMAKIIATKKTKIVITFKNARDAKDVDGGY